MGGGQIDPPLLKAGKNDWNLVKGMFLQKLIIVAHYLCICSWIITIFESKKDKKIDAFLHA